jgi:hypothetical protein
MATRPVEGERLDVVLDRLGQRTRTQAAKPLRLDPARPDPARPGTTAPLDFEDLVEAVAARPRLASTPPLYQEIVDFVMPRLTDTTVLQGGRSASILEHLVSEILPKLGGGEELRRLANAIIADELARRRDVSTRVQAGIAA